MIGFLKSLSRNRLSLAGLVVITAVIFVALVTPLLPLLTQMLLILKIDLKHLLLLTLF